MNLNTTADFLCTEADTSAQSIRCVAAEDFDAAYQALNSQQQAWIDSHDFKGQPGVLIRIPGESGNSIWLGTGNGEPMALRDAAATTAQQLPEGKYQFLMDDDELVIGWLLGQYQFNQYKSADIKVKQLCVTSEQAERLSIVVNGLFLARDLINTPTNDMGPTELAEITKEIAIEYGANFSQVVDEQLLEKGYRTIFTVGMAADNRPRLIDLTWGDENAPKLTLVGKGVCFDSGGLDIKPAAGMRIMKKDMGGAAHALGLAIMIMAAGLNVRLRVLLPAVENSISSNAFRPGDIIKTYKGTTVEIDNTDAEGRLVLCDALTLAGEEQPDLILDFATLTGAARVAMGPEVVPFFTDDEQLASALYEGSEGTYDPVWRLPLFKGYEKDLKSTVADMSNMGKGPFGGAITAALYLKHFVPAEVSWAHFDLYGWNLGRKPTCPEGGQSMAIHAVFDMLSKRYQ